MQEEKGAASRRRFAGPAVLKAISELYAPGGGSRRAADTFLTEFAKCDDVVIPVSFELLRAHLGGQALPAEALLLLATNVWRRARRRPLHGGLAGEEIFGFAAALLPSAPVPAERVARAAVAAWLHEGRFPLQELLGQLSSERSELILMALAALPEEANAKETKIDATRADALLAMATAAPAAVRAIAALSSERSLMAATSWLAICDSDAGLLNDLASSALLVATAARLRAADAEEAPEGCRAATEFVEVLLEKTGFCQPPPDSLVQNLLLLLASLQPKTLEARRRLCRLVASAVGSWRRFVAVSPPPPAWTQLLEALLGCAAWGADSAAIAAGAWLELYRCVMAASSEIQEIYWPVLLKAARSLRNATVFPTDFASWTAEERDGFSQFRREVRDCLREFGAAAPATKGPSPKANASPKARQRDAPLGRLLPLLLKEIHGDIAGHLGGDWRHLEEALHALSALAKELLAARFFSTALLELHGLILGERSPLLEPGCHRQLVSTFLQCAAVFGPLCAQDVALAERLFTMARASLKIPEEVASGPDAAFPFRAKQDHNGAVTLMKLCHLGAPALTRKECAEAVRTDLLQHLKLALASATPPLSPSSTLVLAQAAAASTKAFPDVASFVVKDCLDTALGDPPRSALALRAAAEMAAVAEASAVALALEGAWGSLSQVALDPPALALFLAKAVRSLPTQAVAQLARVVAQIAAARADARSALLSVASVLARRAASQAAEPGAIEVQRIASELIEGLIHLTSAQLGSEGRIDAILQLATQANVWLPPSEGGGFQAQIRDDEREQIEALAEMMREVGRHSPSVLLLAGPQLCQFGFVIKAAVALVAVPADRPPVKALAFLSEVWGEGAATGAAADRGPQEAFRELVGALLQGQILPSWPLGALQLRAVMKALLGQMPPSALGVLIPAARSLVVAFPPAMAGTWATVAASGEGFPQAAMKESSKALFVQELLSGAANAQKVKQALKKFCAKKTSEK